MLQTLQQESFVVGAALVAICQATKFSQLNSGDPVTGRYVALLPGAKVRDFAGPYAYHLALATFLITSLVTYFLLCHVSPELVAGAAKLFGAPDPTSVMKGVQYPLYIAALFLGFTQPIPLLSRFGDAQRDFFHDRIAVPRRVIDLSENLTNAIDARSGASKKRLASELRKLTSADFLTSLQAYGDVPFYKQQLEQLEIDDEGALSRTIKESSLKDLRELIERLVLSALVSVMRRSGPKSLVKVAESLGTPWPRPRHQLRFLLASFLATGVLFSVGLLLIAIALWLAADPIVPLLGGKLDKTLWPSSLENVLLELRAIVPSLLVCLVIAISWLVPPANGRTRRPAVAAESSASSSLASFVDFFRASAGVLGVCILVSVLIKMSLLFYEYKTGQLPREHALNVTFTLILPVIQSFIPAVVCLFTTWYLASSARVTRSLSFTATLLTIALAAGVMGWLYTMIFLPEYLPRYPAYAPAHEYLLFGFLANALVASCAFASVTLFFKARRHLPEVVRMRSARRGTSRREMDRMRSGRARDARPTRGWWRSGRDVG